MTPLFHATKDGRIIVDMGRTDSEKCWRQLRTLAKVEKRSQNRPAMRRRGYDVIQTGWIAL